MIKPVAVVSAAALVLLCAVVLIPLPAWGQTIRVSGAVHHDVSLPLSSMMAKPRQERHLMPEHHLPLMPGRPQPDPVLQTMSGPLVGTTAGLNFAGVGDGDYGFAPNAAPPDTNGAAGATQYVQWVN